MIPYSDKEYLHRLHLLGTVFILTRRKEDGEIEHLILEYEEVMLKELQDDKQELR